MWVPRRLTTLWAFTACYRDSFTFLLSSGCWVLFQRGVKRLRREAEHSVYLVPGSRMEELYLRPRIRLHGEMPS
jgi:hypothetical protein